MITEEEYAEETAEMLRIPPRLKKYLLLGFALIALFATFDVSFSGFTLEIDFLRTAPRSRSAAVVSPRGGVAGNAVDSVDVIRAISK